MWIGIILAVIVIGVIIAFIPKKKNIPVKYAEAKKLFEDGEVVKACSLMDEIIIFSISEKYTYDEAKQMIQSLQLLKEICRAQNIDKDAMIDPVIAAFKAVPEEGGVVSSNVTDGIDKFVSRISGSTDALINTMIDEASNGNIVSGSQENEKDFVDDITDDNQNSIINKSGKYLMKGNIKEGIAFIDSHMPEEMGPFKASLLDQKSGLLFMDNKFQEAVEIEEQILEDFPDNNRTRCGLAEGLVKLGRIEEAVKHAKIVAQSTKDKYLLKTANDILQKYEMPE